MKAESFSYHCFENILGSPVFVENLITTFQENPRLGLLVPPTPVHSDFHISLGNEWQNNFENALLLAKRLNINVDIDKAKPPIAPMGGIYWYRTKALKALFEIDFSYDEFPEEPIQDSNGTLMRAIECLYPFIAQQTGFYTGWVLSDISSKMELTNLYKILGDFNRVLLWKFGLNSRYTFMDIIAKSNSSAIKQRLHANQYIKSLIKKMIGRRGLYFVKNIWKHISPDKASTFKS
jgi:rhamnosyltransferase